MVATIKKYKAAAVNAEPGWLNLELSIQKTIHWINEAGQNGCKLIAFPELCMFITNQSCTVILLTEGINRGSWLPLLDVACQLPRIFASAEEVPREQSSQRQP
mgnify:FL=1